MIIIHIIDSDTWIKNKDNSLYFGDTLKTQGFIHCCLPEQVDDVLENWFSERDDLIFLEIDSDKLAARLELENSDGGEEKFPHIYGPIEHDAIISWYPYTKNKE